MSQLVVPMAHSAVETHLSMYSKQQTVTTSYIMLVGIDTAKYISIHILHKGSVSQSLDKQIKRTIFLRHSVVVSQVVGCQ